MRECKSSSTTLKIAFTFVLRSSGPIWRGVLAHWRLVTWSYANISSDLCNHDDWWTGERDKSRKLINYFVVGFPWFLLIAKLININFPIRREEIFPKKSSEAFQRTRELENLLKRSTLAHNYVIKMSKHASLWHKLSGPVQVENQAGGSLHKLADCLPWCVGFWSFNYE